MLRGLRQHPLVVLVSPLDRGEGARNLIFIFICTSLQGRQKLISIFIGAALSLFILTLTRYSRSPCLLSFLQVLQMHGKVVIWPKALPILLTPIAMTLPTDFAPFTGSESEDSFCSGEDSSSPDNERHSTSSTPDLTPKYCS